MQISVKEQLDKMNEMQRKAAEHTEGPLLILAGAGSGKTTVLINRIAVILENKLCYPSNILAITFTNKAAKELVNRIDNLLGDEAKGVWASTFHSFCSKVLRRNINILGFSNDFSIFDTDDSIRVIKSVQKNLGIDPQILPARAVLSRISMCKNNRILPKDYMENFGNDVYNRDIYCIYTEYEKQLAGSNALDFDDIILKAVTLFEKSSEVLNYYSNKFKYIMVDEYQDTNPLQYRLIYLLQSAHHNICVVGDDDQSIYKFRGATIENILSFEKTFKDATVIRLEQNYRSTANILDAANNVISNNSQRKGKTLWTASDKGEPIYENRLDDEYQESLFIADTILDSVAVENMHYKDFAVLYRTNAQSNSLEQMFVKSGIPYKIIGGVRFYERKEIKDILAYLYLVHNTNDDLRLTRIINEPKRKIGQATLDTLRNLANGNLTSMYDIAQNAGEYPELARSMSKLGEFCALINLFRNQKESMPISELIKEISVKSGYISMLEAENTEEARDRINNIAELVSTAAIFESQSQDATLGAFLEEIALMTDIDNLDESSDRVILMTLHSAKGLEFNNVFISGVEEGLFPGQKSIESQEEIEEERRLMYVGITRAKKRLYLTHTLARTIFGTTKYNKPSRFLKEIPSEIIKPLYNKDKQGISAAAYSSPLSSRVITKTADLNTSAKILRPSAPASAACIELEPGKRVVHKTFGPGTIISKKPMGGDTLLEINFDKTGTKKIMANFARLKEE